MFTGKLKKDLVGSSGTDRDAGLPKSTDSLNGLVWLSSLRNLGRFGVNRNHMKQSEREGAKSRDFYQLPMSLCTLITLGPVTRPWLSVSSSKDSTCSRDGGRSSWRSQQRSTADARTQIQVFPKQLSYDLFWPLFDCFPEVLKGSLGLGNTSYQHQRKSGFAEVPGKGSPSVLRSIWVAGTARNRACKSSPEHSSTACKGFRCSGLLMLSLVRKFKVPIQLTLLRLQPSWLT